MTSQRPTLRTPISRRISVGALFWILSIQYFIIQIVVALAWQPAYSLTRNTISDLGNTVCGQYGENFVCSPRHALMNASFIVLGTTMIAGSVLLHRGLRPKLKRGGSLGFILMGLAGVGTTLVGLFPENTVSSMHILGASMPFLLGNIALLIFSRSLPMSPILRIYTLASGIITLLALTLFMSHIYLGIGIGGMERFVGYPQTLWLIIFGLYAARRSYIAKLSP